MSTYSKLSRLAQLATVAVAATLALTSCSSGEADDATAGASTEESLLLPEAEGTTQYPLTLETPWGETVLEERPERVVALSTTDTELVAALGGTPVATQGTLDRALWTQEALPGDIEEIYDWNGLDEGMPYEEIAASEPDLIIFSGADLSDGYERLSTIAPVLAPETEEAVDAGLDWRTEIQAIGEALDLSDAADQAAQKYDDFFAQARQENPEFEGLTATYLLQYGEEYGTVYASAPGGDEARLLEDLGFEPNPLAAQFADDDLVSPEMLSQVDADVLIIGAANSDEADVERLLTGTELFKQVGAVEEGNWDIFYSTDDGSGYIFAGQKHPGNINWALAHGGAVIGKPWAAEQLIPVLRSALDLDDEQ